jgi:hypothetical protein
MAAKRLLLLSVFFLSACKPPTPSEQMDSILSWLGTAVMAGGAWLHHTTPDTYTRQTLELSHKTLEQISKDLLATPPDATDTAALDSVLTRSRARIARMGALITARNSPEFSRELGLLHADQLIVKQFADSIGSKQ